LNMKNHSGHALSSDIFGVKHVYRPARFSQVTDHLPVHTFRRCVQRYQGERSDFMTIDSLNVMVGCSAAH
jgi:hypothetical protein